MAVVYASLGTWNAATNVPALAVVTNSPTGSMPTINDGNWFNYYSVTTASPGSITGITLTSTGFGYGSAPTVTFSAPTGGITALSVATTNGTNVTGLVLSDGGSGYSSVPAVTFGGPGTGATATAVLGIVADVTVTAAGTGYVQGAAVTFTGANTVPATGTINVTPTGAITSINLTARGSGYAAAPTVTFPTGTGATATVLIDTTVVGSLTLTAGGTGYSSIPAVTIAAPVGVLALGTAVIAGGIVTGVTINTAGTNYLPAATITFSGGTPTSPATATPIVTPGPVSYPNAQGRMSYAINDTIVVIPPSSAFPSSRWVKNPTPGPAKAAGKTAETTAGAGGLDATPITTEITPYAIIGARGKKLFPPHLDWSYDKTTLR